MHDFAVWAPRPERVELVTGSQRLPMRRRGGGWWAARARQAGPGSEYGFSLDGGPARPDPRSASQPGGIEGLSRVIDHGAFAWTDAGWRGLALPGAVLYECHIGTFSAAGHLRRGRRAPGPPGRPRRGRDRADAGRGVLRRPAAGATTASGLFAPHHAYGGPEGLKRLVDAAHARGLGVVIDVVYNHLGPAGNYLAEFGPYFSARHQTNWGDGVNLDGPDSDEVRRFIVDNALSWLRDYHADGLRLDAVHAIADDSAVHILEQLATETGALAARLRKPLFLIAESDRNDPRLVRGQDAGGYGLDAAWADEWHHALHAVLTGERDGYYSDFGSLGLLAKALRQAWVYDGVYSPHRRRVHGRPPAGLSGRQFVVATQNHDQVGNRAAGERSGALMSHGRLQDRRGAAAHLAVRAAAVPGRGMGRGHPVPVLHRLRRHRARPGGQHGAAAGVRRVRLGPGGRARPAGRRHLRALPAELGRAGREGRMPTCSPGTAACSRCGARPPS